MFKFLDKYILIEFLKTFIMISLLFLPMLYLADFFLQDSFLPLEALKKLISRFGQIINIVCLFSMYSTIQKIRYKHGDIAFLSVGFEKQMGIKIIMIIAFLIMNIYAFLIIPSNDYFFKKKIFITEWAILKKQEQVFFIHNKKSNQEMWIYDLNKNEFSSKKNYFHLSNNDFYIVWNEVKKLSFLGLNEYQRYLIKHNLNYDHVVKQRNSYLAKIFLIFAMLLCGYAFAWRNSLIWLFLCCVISTWLDQISFFIPSLEQSIFSIWINVLIWCILGICFLFIF